MTARRVVLGALTSLLWMCSAYAGQNAAGSSTEPPQHATIPRAPDSTAASVADPDTLERWASGRYRITPSDVIELKFPYVPEFDQVVTVQPDGYVTLRGIGDVYAQSRSVPELRQIVQDSYASILRDPVVTITLRDFEKPYFIAAGQVKTPGKFELRGPMTLTQGIALAGGLTDMAKHSQVVLFRRYSDDMLEVKQVDVKRMYASKDLSEDYLLRPGDTIFVPKSLISRLKPFLPTAGIGLYLNPFSW
jgi:polysaccharide export outer membrane protein